MKAAVLREFGKPLEIENVRIDKPGPREVLVRTVATGVCHSDLHLAEGTYPYVLPVIPGHEAAGVVEQVGEQVRSVRPGDHVITCISAHCGHCEPCLTGHMVNCATPEADRGPDLPPRLMGEGSRPGPITQMRNLSAFAEYMLIPESTCVAVRKDMPFDVAALIGCAVTTGMGAVTNTARVPAGATVAVIGCGGIGLSAINGAQIAGASRIIAIDMLPGKLELAREFGATDIVDASTGNVAEQVRELTKGGVHYSFEAVGNKQACEDAFMMLRSNGLATLIGLQSPATRLEFPFAPFFEERAVKGSRMGSNRFPVDMPRYVEFYMQGRLKLDRLVSRRIKLEDINDAFEELKRGELARSVIMFD